MPRRLAGATLCLALFVAPVGARGQSSPPPAERSQVYSRYELETIDEALQAFRAEREPSPEGKVIERVEILPFDVIENRDLGVVIVLADALGKLFDIDSNRVRGRVRRALDALHTTSKKYVVGREVLLRVGEPYRQQAMDDTIRNLRVLPQLSLVVAVPIRGTTPDTVGVIVVTKDVWSIRPNWGFELSSGGIDELSAQPAEINVAGLHHTAYLNLDLLPKSFTLGAGYNIPRLGGTRVQLYSNANVLFNRDTSSLEGTFGQLTTGQTLFSARTKWSWDATVVWTDAILRRYENAQVGVYKSPTTGLTVPFEYRANAYQTGYEATRSFGWDTKHDITFGAGINRAVYSTDLTAYDPRTVADFVQNEVPVSDTRVGPWVTYHGYTKRYVRVFDFETLALQEDYRLGPDVYLRLYPSPKALGSTRDILGIYASAMYTLPIRDGLVRLAVQDVTDFEPSSIPDASVTTSGRIVSPTILGLGRIVVDGYLLYRWRNYLNASSFLGGDTRLRGYPTAFTTGADVMSYNIELRTRPLDILTFHLAAVAFYDVGDAFTGWSSFRPLQAAGFGLRGMLPQIDRVVYRFDVGFPLGEGRNLPGVTPVALLFTLGQAFDVPSTTTVGGQNISGNSSGIVGVTPVLPTGQ
jgi:hypothetical protein